MKSTFLQTLAEVDSLLDSREYKQALNVLEKIDLQKIETEEDRSKYHYMYARYYRGVGKYDKALEEIESTLTLSRKTDNHSLYASQKHLLGLICMSLGKITDAIEAYNEAYVFRKRAGEHEKVYGSLVNQAFAHFLKGNLPVALSVLDDALEYAERYNGPDEIRVCQTNRSRVMILLGEFEVSNKILQYYYSAPDIDKPDKAFVLQSLGMINAFMLEKREASNYLIDALNLYKELNMQLELVVCLEFLGLNEYLAGNYAKAKEYYLDILGRDEITASARAQTLRMLTDVYIAVGDLDKATETAKQAEEAIKKVNEQIELGALYRAYGQIYAHKRDQRMALDYFRKSIRLQRETGARYELALTYLTFGRSETYSMEQRLQYLSMARDLFEEMGIPKRVEHIAKELISQQPASPRALGSHSRQHAIVHEQVGSLFDALPEKPLISESGLTRIFQTSIAIVALLIVGLLALAFWRGASSDIVITSAIAAVLGYEAYCVVAAWIRRRSSTEHD